MALRVLVTRPGSGAARTAARLADCGFTPIRFPLTAIVGLPVAGLLPDGQCDAVAVTSANALRHAPADLISGMRHLPCFAVGAESAKAAAKAGFGKVVEGDADGERLAARIVATLGSGATIVYLCGRKRTPGFERGVMRGGVTVRPIETYDAPAIDYDTASLDHIVGTEPIHAALLYSPRAASLFSHCAWSETAKSGLRHALFACLSAQVASELRGVDASLVRIADEPNEPELLRMLAEHDRAPFQGKLV